MNLKEFKYKIDELYKKHGDIGVVIDLSTDTKDDSDIVVKDNGLYTENVLDITETTNYLGEVNGICISNYIMEDNK